MSAHILTHMLVYCVLPMLLASYFCYCMSFQHTNQAQNADYTRKDLLNSAPSSPCYIERVARCVWFESGSGRARALVFMGRSTNFNGGVKDGLMNYINEVK